MSSVQIVTSNTIRNTEGYTLSLERGTVTRRTNTNYEYVNHPVIIPRPRIEDFNALVVVHNQVEFYS